MKIILRQKYYNSELYAYYLLKDILFNKSNTYIGDSGNAPDLMTDDCKIGCEVTCSEDPSIFTIMKKLGFDKKNSKKYKSINLKYVNKKYIRLKSYSDEEQNEKQIFTLYKKDFTLQDKEEYLNHFNYIVSKKLKKLNRGLYNDCENVFLIVLSDFRLKPNVNIEELQNIYKNLCKEYSRNFCAVFVTINNKVYLFDANEIRLMKDNVTYNKQKDEAFKKLNIKDYEQSL